MHKHELSPRTYEQSSSPERTSDEKYFLGELVDFYLLDRAIGLTDQQQAYDSGTSQRTAEDLIEARFNSWDAFSETVRNGNSARRLTASYEQILQENFARLEPVAEQLRSDTPAVLTACVPLAICHEAPDTIRTLLGQVQKSQKALNEPVEVLFWANANYTPGSESEVTASAHASYEQLRTITKEFASDGIRIDTALEIVPKEDFSMSKVRQHYMDALVAKAVATNMPVQHAVMWLDADTTFLSKNCFSEVVEWADEPAVGFFHPDIDYSASWAAGQLIDSLDIASKAFVADEVQRRELRKDAYETNAVTPFEYVDEPGLSFSLMTYLLSGGVNPSYPIDETEMLFRKLRINRELPIMDTLAEDYAAVFDEEIDTRPPINEWNRNARVIVSGRRIYEQAKKHGIAGLATSRTNSIGQSEYELFTDIKKDSSSSQELDPAEVRQYIAEHTAALSPRRAETVKKIVKRIL